MHSWCPHHVPSEWNVWWAWLCHHTPQGTICNPWLDVLSLHMPTSMRQRPCQVQVCSVDGWHHHGDKSLWVRLLPLCILWRYVCVWSIFQFFVQVRLCHLIHTHVCPKQMLGVDDDVLNNILNEMFFLNGENVNPKLCVGGALRPMLEWALAALIMYMTL